MPEEESIFRKIKTRLLPQSSRSFHSCMGELRDANRIMREQNETLIAMAIPAGHISRTISSGMNTSRAA